MSPLQASDIPFHKNSGLLFENENFIIIDKPSGVLSHPNSSEDQANSIINASYDKNSESFLIEKQKIFLLHRLDKETSGCLMFAKNVASSKKLKIDFENHTIYKEYIALLTGRIKPTEVWKNCLIKKANRTVVDQQGKPNAVTNVKSLEFFSKTRMTLVRFVPKTGKTHQLRVQSSFRHVPILGDRQYGNFTKNKDAKQKWNLDRMFLHASKITFTDPSTRKKIDVESPLPQDLRELIDIVKGKV